MKFPVSFSPSSIVRNTGGTVSGTLVIKSPIMFNSAGIYFGTGIPENSITAAVGSIWLREDGSGTSTLYVKKTGAGNIGWVEIT